jgi:hypothetical protein
MDRRRFISIAGGAVLEILLPYAVHKSLFYGCDLEKASAADNVRRRAHAPGEIE